MFEPRFLKIILYGNHKTVMIDEFNDAFGSRTYLLKN